MHEFSCGYENKCVLNWLITYL